MMEKYTPFQEIIVQWGLYFLVLMIFGAFISVEICVCLGVIGLVVMVAFLADRSTERKNFQHKLEALIRKGDRRELHEVLTAPGNKNWQLLAADRAMAQLEEKGRLQGQ